MKIFEYKNLPCDFFSKIEFENITSVIDIINDVKINKDAAVRKYSLLFDKQELGSFKITKEQIKDAYKKTSIDVVKALKYAAKNITTFAQAQYDSIKNQEIKIGENILGHKIIPINSVGCYIPGGNYPLPSTALMTAIPAKVAGVKKVIACSPKIKPVTIVACDIAQVDEIFSIGGVQAISAMAWGTETITPVDKIVGPGNKFVTAAKKQVFGQCGIDFLAGPSEVLIIADDSASPEFVAADMLAQCEHDYDARAYLVCFSEDFAQKVKFYAFEYLKKIKTSEIAQKSFDNSFAVVVETLEQAIKISEEKAPEHLEICLSDAKNKIDLFSNYGSLFIGNYSAEVFGDYASGTNHTLPTNQVAKYSGGLSIFDFIKVQTYQIIDKNDMELKKQTSLLAKEEGLFAHKLASDIRQ